MKTKDLCTKWSREGVLRLTAVTALLLGSSFANNALAVQSPPDCNANTLNLTLSRSTGVAVPGQTVTFGVSVAVPATDVGGSAACDTSNVTITAQCPDAANNIPPTTPVQTLATDQSYPAGTAPTSVGSINCVMPDVPVNKAITAVSTATGLLLDTDLLPGSSFERSNGITVTVTPCQVKVDKQVSCDNGATWVDPGLVLNNEDGTLDCSVVGLTGPVKVRYQASNTSTSCNLTECALTETNPTFGTVPSVGIIAPNATTAFLPAADSPACSTAYGNPENPNEPNTVGITCQTGGTPVTASDTASFSCLKVDATVDRAVNCGEGFNDQTQVRTNEDGTNGCNTVDGQPVNWQYKACNAGTAPLYDCTLVDQNLTVSAPIVVGPLGAGLCSANTPATGNPVLCSNTLEASEAPDQGKVTLTCCTTDVSSITDCSDGNRVQVYDASTVSCSTPSGLNAVKSCVDTDLDGTADNVRVTASATSGDVGFVNCTATDTIFLDDDSCEPPVVGLGTNIPLTPEGGVTSPFSIAAGGSQSLFGTITPALDQDACNTASVTCNIAGTTTAVTAIAPPVVCPFEEREGCFTRTPGYWGTHTGTNNVGTSDFLPQTVCGVELNNVSAGNGNSAIEAMCSVGKDGKILGQQETQLIRQCTAAYLNVEATRDQGGECLSNSIGSSGYAIGTVLSACCDDNSICTGDGDDTGTGLSIGDCITLVDEFNNSDDTLVKTDAYLFNKPGKADPATCQDAKNNGTVVNPL